MTAIEALRNGDLELALSQVKDDVRNEPQVSKHRVFLFQLFAITGDWTRSLSQLKVASDLDKECQTMGEAYQHILQCEALRGEVFEGKRAPLIFGEPEAWIAKMIEALRLSGEKKYEAASALQSEALEDAEPSAGRITLRPRGDAETGESVAFEWIADADSRIGPFMEVIMQGKYYWVPFQRIQEVQFHDVSDLRDYVWIAAQFTWVGGGEMVGMVPTRYPGSQDSDDGLIQLGRKTDWKQVGDESYLGLGQRMLATDQDDYALLDLAAISFDAPS
ncbi:type VI secretion system accessory protein TagJ [Aporhodopirellula aestuarii]|uniref:Virulence protein SciE type n=1 Tax=Aporhodopirellula aestuarii TaxID=2950107 RepID=A0ABT0TZ48_9BACT|nr:type VI secretion system accessory protein TagJ [Aporhodopirellula aestuarii]MCM2369877.1 virulence protein SciE type [Aporhodopirellula aestuarii]